MNYNKLFPLQIKEQIGKGAQATVYIVERQQDNEKFLLKKVCGLFSPLFRLIISKILKLTWIILSLCFATNVKMLKGVLSKCPAPNKSKSNAKNNKNHSKFRGKKYRRILSS